MKIRTKAKGVDDGPAISSIMGRHHRGEGTPRDSRSKMLRQVEIRVVRQGIELDNRLARRYY